ncbi:MAG: DUF2344 domain-containing protein [Planctomycetes bacterium]|nr:DUF2344 domain-containing protein [Planctomycetota bacterium]
MVVADARHPTGLCLSKDGDARFLGHLDFGRVVERALRRSGLPVCLTEGFNPRLRVSFADALPVGLASQGEWITVILSEAQSPEQVRRRLEPALPECVKLVDVCRGAPAAASGATSFRIDVLSGERAAADALTALLERTSFAVEDARHGSIDVRSQLRTGCSEGSSLVVELQSADDRPPRPAPLTRALVQLAGDLGIEPPVLGVVTKLLPSERRPGDHPWHDAGNSKLPRSSSSTPPSARRAGSPSSRMAS